jgi:hypothetical protein
MEQVHGIATCSIILFSSSKENLVEGLPFSCGHVYGIFARLFSCASRYDYAC